MKRILKYIVIFLLVVAFLLSFLVATAKIPKEIISENVKKSERCFKTDFEIEEIDRNKEYTYLHIYADAVLLNIAYCFDENNPLESVLEAKYYVENERREKRGIFDYNFRMLVDTKQAPNKEYIRYWHGSAGILRILLIFMDLGQIYIFNVIVLSILLVILLILLLKNKAITLAISLIVSLVMIVCIFVPFCLEYTWTFYIMLISSILSIIWKDKQEKLNMLFFITGMITCFLDFLSTEIITIAVPLLIVVVLQSKDKKITNGKEAIKLIIKSIFLWTIAYASMWFAKWIIASIVLKIDAFKYVKDKAKVRINGKISGIEKNQLWWYAIKRNLLTLYPLKLQKETSKLLVIPIIMAILEVIIIRKKDLKKLWLSGVILLIGILPYIRYILLSNHSYTHFFFTFRSQIVTVMAVILAMVYSIDIDFWKKKFLSKIKN